MDTDGKLLRLMAEWNEWTYSPEDRAALSRRGEEEKLEAISKLQQAIRQRKRLKKGVKRGQGVYRKWTTYE